MIFYRIVQFLVKFFFLFVFRIRVHGKENMLNEDGAVVAINHKSNWDVPIVGVYTPRQLGFMAKAELFKNKALGWLFKSLGAFPVQRGKGDISAIKSALLRLRNGEIVAMFPEGKRVKNDEVVNAKPGAVMLATRAKVPIIPIKISGKYKWMAKIDIYIGKPIDFSQYYNEKLTVDDLQKLTDELMDTLRKLDKAE